MRPLFRFLAFTSLFTSIMGIQAAEPPPAVEKDGRLHSDGRGWKLNRAVIKDPTLPRVLLIGDSIVGGYMGGVVKELDGKANVDAWMHPHAQSTHLNKLLGDMLNNGPYDVVHFNMGLHGWQKDRIKEGTFEPLTKAFIEVIRVKNPKTKIIWANITPVTVKGKPTELDPEINPVIIEQNRMAAQVMVEEKVPINNFYGTLITQLGLARGDQFHWNAEAYKILAGIAASSIEKELPSKASP